MLGALHLYHHNRSNKGARPRIPSYGGPLPRKGEGRGQRKDGGRENSTPVCDSFFW